MIVAKTIWKLKRTVKKTLNAAYPYYSFPSRLSGDLPRIRAGQKYVRQVPGADTERRIKITNGQKTSQRTNRIIWLGYSWGDYRRKGAKIYFTCPSVSDEEHCIPADAFANQYATGDLERVFISVAGFGLVRSGDGISIRALDTTPTA